MEIIAFILIFAMIILQSSYSGINTIINNPFPNVVIPAIMLTAYLTLYLKKYFGSNLKKIIIVSGVFIFIFFVLFFSVYSLANNNEQSTGDQSGIIFKKQEALRDKCIRYTSYDPVAKAYKWEYNVNYFKTRDEAIESCMVWLKDTEK